MSTLTLTPISPFDGASISPSGDPAAWPLTAQQPSDRPSPLPGQAGRCTTTTTTAPDDSVRASVRHRVESLALLVSGIVGGCVVAVQVTQVHVTSSGGVPGMVDPPVAETLLLLGLLVGPCIVAWNVLCSRAYHSRTVSAALISIVQSVAALAAGFALGLVVQSYADHVATRIDTAPVSLGETPAHLMVTKQMRNERTSS